VLALIGVESMEINLPDSHAATNAAPAENENVLF